MNTIEPLTPSDCDLRDFRRQPFDVVRVLDSDTFALLDAVDFKASFALWCKAWHQVPAGSVPDDDRVLARLAFLSLSEWQSVRPRVLASWRHCTDGRFYHPVVSEMALEALLERLDAALRGGAGNARRWGSAYDRDGLLTRRRDAVSRLLALNPSAKVKAAPNERKVTNDPPAKTEDRGSDVKGSRQRPKNIATEREREREREGIDSSLRSESDSSSSDSREPRPFNRREWFERIVEASGPGLPDPAKQPRLWLDAGELDSWAKRGIDLELDAVPVIAQMTEKPKRDPPQTLRYFRAAVFTAHATRTADLSPDLDKAKADSNARPERPASRHASSAAALDSVLASRKARDGGSRTE